MSNDNEDLVVVLEATSEMEALSIQSFLESSDVEAALKSRQIPMFNGVATALNPVWGYVLVMSSDKEKAELLIKDYLENLDKPEKGD